MKKLEHGMLLDAKQVIDLGICDYLLECANYDSNVVNKVYHRLMEDLASCDVSKRYKEIENG
jgi:hypothetical protein